MYNCYTTTIRKKKSTECGGIKSLQIPFPSLDIVSVLYGINHFLLVSFDIMSGPVVVGTVEKKEEEKLRLKCSMKREEVEKEWRREKEKGCL